MPSKFFYYARTFAAAGLSVSGIRASYEQPPYTVRADLGGGLEIRDYPATMAAEATDTTERGAFGLLFNYIAGGNIAMTSPVRREPAAIAMTTPVRIDAAAGSGVAMRFFLPARTAAMPPEPVDPRVRLVAVPASTVAALRFGGNPTASARRANETALLSRLAETTWRPSGSPWCLAYDPPFAIPFLKRNEIAVTVSANSR